MGIKAQELIDGCFARAALDEPLFVLRAQDVSAPALVREWAEQFRQDHIDNRTAGYALAKAIAKHTEALEVADKMEKWRLIKLAD
jgi:hypothetical protein